MLLPLGRVVNAARRQIAAQQSGWALSSAFHPNVDLSAQWRRPPPKSLMFKRGVHSQSVSVLEQDNFAWDSTAFVDLLGRFIGVADQVQNAPSLGLVPKENVISDLVLHDLKPFMVENGGVLTAERIEFAENRGHVILRYKHPEVATPNKTIGFVGSHMDVVPASPEGWRSDPFKLTVEGDKLFGRGTSDCLGHVALLTLLFKELARTKPKLNTEVAAVLIVSEENSEIPGIGVEKLMETGRIDFIKNGPVFWFDGVDHHPCIGTAGTVVWSLKAYGKLYHSGLASGGINALELGMDALAHIQKRFYDDFRPLSQEKEYNFSCPSTMKPTRVETSSNGINQIPPWVKIVGDIRLSPFYEIKDVMEKVQSYVDDLNRDIRALEGARGPVSKYALPHEKLEGRLELHLDDDYMEGIACSLDSVGFKALSEATARVKGESKPFSISGSLPLVRDLQRDGMDLVVMGYGIGDVIHGDNEYCLLSDMRDGMNILARTVAGVEKFHSKTQMQ